MINSYAVPMEAIRFAFRHIAFEEDTPALEVDEALFTQILEQAGRFATDRLIPINLPGDRDGVNFQDGVVRTSPAFRDAYRDWTSAGWLGVCAPESMGGSALPRAITAPLDEIWNAANMSFHICPTLTQAALKLILAHGSAEQRDAYLPQLISGRYTASMGLTESHAGSDLSTITTRATPLADGTYQLRGAKIFTSFGEHDWSENILVDKI